MTGRMRSAPPHPEALAEPPHPAVGQRGVVIPRVELQRDEGHVDGDGGQQGLHRLVGADGHVLRAPGLEGHAVCEGEGGVTPQLSMWLQDHSPHSL